jgi:hypothetical protein
MAPDLEKAKRIPVVSGAIKQCSENQENSFLAGLSFPLPTFNTQDTILAAQKRLTKAQNDKRAAIMYKKAPMLGR